MRTLVNVYLKLLEIHPWKTTCITTGVLTGFGDFIAQQAVERRGLKNHDTRRNIKMICLGLFVIGPGLRKWYLILDRLVYGTSSSAALKKMVLDQTIWAPAINATLFMLSDKIDGKTNDEIKENLSNSYIDAMKVNYMLWPAVQLMNFYFVPFQHRVLVVNTVALFWNTYLAWILNKKKN